MTMEAPLYRPLSRGPKGTARVTFSNSEADFDERDMI